MPLNAQNALNPTLLAMLACPSDDHAPLREESHDGADTLVCTYCATRFPIEDGIPVLLLDDATPGPYGIGVAADGSSAAIGEPAGAVPAVEVAVDEIVAAEPAGPDAESVEPVASPAAGDAVPGLPFDPRVSPKHALPDGVEDTGLPETAAVSDTAEVSDTVDLTETVQITEAADVVELADVDGLVEVPDVADVVEVADVLDADDVVDDEVPAVDMADADGSDDTPETSTAPTTEPTTEPTASAPGSPRRPQSPPPARTLAAALRNRVEHRLAEFEANRGPRRRRGTGR